MNWLTENWAVLFSGIAVPPTFYLLGKFFLKKEDTKQIKQKQTAGKSSINIQVGGNVEINKKDV